jgi:hypothetical protein
MAGPMRASNVPNLATGLALFEVAVEIWNCQPLADRMNKSARAQSAFEIFPLTSWS